jgi:hypothetical protein
LVLVLVLAATFGLRPTTTTASPAGLLITDFKLAHTAAAHLSGRRRRSRSITTTSSRRRRRRTAICRHRLLCFDSWFFDSGKWFS